MIPFVPPPANTIVSNIFTRTDQAARLGSQRQNLGEGLMCPAGAGNLQNDVYGRPATQNTLLLNDSACSNYTEFSAQGRIAVESRQRPTVPICAAGNRGAADFQGVGRDLMPENLYGEGYRGSFIRTYNTPNNSPPYIGNQCAGPAFYQKKIQPFAFSHDATSHLWRG